MPFSKHLCSFLQSMSNHECDAEPLLRQLADHGSKDALRWIRESTHQDAHEAMHAMFDILVQEQKERLLVRSVFGVDLKSLLKCGCDGQSETSENKLCLELPLAGTTLCECLQAFFDDEDIGAETRCPFNTCDGATGKQVEPTAIGRCLVLQLKRFGYDRVAKEPTKLDSDVSFPIVLTKEELITAGVLGAAQCWLYAVIVHAGTANFGHYTCYVRHRLQWFFCNDTETRVANELEVTNAQAYMLFYETDRVKVDSPLRAKIQQLVSQGRPLVGLTSPYVGRADLEALQAQEERMKSLIEGTLQASPSPIRQVARAIFLDCLLLASSSHLQPFDFRRRHLRRQHPARNLRACREQRLVGRRFARMPKFACTHCTCCI